jgi:hypothetical protein
MQSSFEKGLVPAIPGFVEVAMGIVSTELIKYFSNLGSILEDSELNLKLNNYELMIAPILGLPNCQYCSN